MQFETFSLPHITGGTHTDQKAKLFVLTLSVDIHQAYTAKQDVTEAIYAETLLAGAGTLPRAAFLDTLYKTGGSIAVSVNRSIITVTVRGQITAAPKLLLLLKTMLAAPTFAASEIERIKTNLHNELVLQKEDVRGQAQRALQNALFGASDRRQSAAIPTLQKALRSITKEELTTLHEHVLAGPWTVTMSGNDAIIAQVKKVLEAVKGKHQPQTVTPAHAPILLQKRIVVTESIPSKHNVELSIGGPLPLTLHHPDYLPFVFGLAVLGKWGGFAGRLMSTVREKEGLTYSIYARTESVSGNETGYWRIMTFFAPDKTMTGLASTLREIELIAKKGITDKELERFRTILQTQQSLQNDSLLSSLGDLHGYLSEGFTLDQMAEYKARLVSVTKKEVNDALKKHLRSDALVISAAGPVAKVKKELDALGKQFN